MKDLEHIVGQSVGTNIITFNEDELTPGGTSHVKSLYIVVECKGMIISRVLIDKGSALTVYLVLTLGPLSIETLSSDQTDDG